MLAHDIRMGYVVSVLEEVKKYDMEISYESLKSCFFQAERIKELIREILKEKL